MRIAYQASADVRAALARIGRTEDVHFSPSATRLAVAGFDANRILILETQADSKAGTPSIALTAALELESPGFRSPHGLFWLDECSLLVACRFGEIMLFELPEAQGSGRLALAPARTFGGDPADLVSTPGSLSVMPVGLGLVALVVCNNYGNHITRHLLDARAGYALVASEALIIDGFEVPDSVAHSPSGRWLAISNHGQGNVLIFEDDGTLGPDSRPSGALAGISYPHGLRFTPDERSLLVADAGGPFVDRFASDNGDWAGDRMPDASIRVMDDRVYARARASPSHGGPKGIALTADGATMAVTSEAEPLALFDLHALIGEMGATPPRHDGLSEAERARAALLGCVAAARPGIDGAIRAMRETSDQQVAQLLNSRSWRMTGPLRRIRAVARRLPR